MSPGRFLVVAIAFTACQKGEAPSPQPAPQKEHAVAVVVGDEDADAYRQDIARLCDVMTLSGADQLDEGSRMFTVADWLGNNLVTDAGHDFLVGMQQLEGGKKGAMLRDEASRLGLPPCALAEIWK